MRIGFGNDIHRLVYDRKLVLAGVNVPYFLGEQAHSDGDVVYHALSDAILGALALGDIGKYFPDNNPKYKNMDSKNIVEFVYKTMSDRKYSIGNIDITITLEEPKLRPFVDLMRDNISKLLNTRIENISIKACTNESLDSIGQRLAVKAECVVLLKEVE